MKKEIKSVKCPYCDSINTSIFHFNYRTVLFDNILFKESTKFNIQNINKTGC